MFGIGMQEIIVILVLALIVIGPKKLPEVAKALGKGYGEFRRAFEDMKKSINTDINLDEERERLREIGKMVSSDSDEPPAAETPPKHDAAPPSAEGSGETSQTGESRESAGGEVSPVEASGDPPDPASVRGDEERLGG